MDSVFTVDLTALDLTDAQLQAIERAIRGAVVSKLIECSDAQLSAQKAITASWGTPGFFAKK